MRRSSLAREMDIVNGTRSASFNTEKSVSARFTTGGFFIYLKKRLIKTAAASANVDCQHQPFDRSLDLNRRADHLEDVVRRAPDKTHPPYPGSFNLSVAEVGLTRRAAFRRAHGSDIHCRKSLRIHCRSRLARDLFKSTGIILKCQFPVSIIVCHDGAAVRADVFKSRARARFFAGRFAEREFWTSARSATECAAAGTWSRTLSLRRLGVARHISPSRWRAPERPRNWPIINQDIADANTARLNSVDGFWQFGRPHTNCVHQGYTSTLSRTR